MPITTTAPQESVRKESGELSPEELLTLPMAEYISYMKNRTPEQIAATRERLRVGTTPPRPLPPGKTLEDVIVGQVDFGVSDEELARILKEVS
jgi:hypothetical protein